MKRKEEQIYRGSGMKKKKTTKVRDNDKDDD